MDVDIYIIFFQSHFFIIIASENSLPTSEDIKNILS